MKPITENELKAMESTLANLFQCAGGEHEQDLIVLLHERLLEEFENQQSTRTSADRLRSLASSADSEFFDNLA